MNTYKTLLTTSASLAFALSAQAATLTFNDTIAVTEIGSLTGVNELSVQQFDSALGSLTGVTLTITLEVPSATIQIDNDFVNAADVDAIFGTVGGSDFSSSASTFNGSATLSGSDFNFPTDTQSFSLAGNTGDGAGFDSQTDADSATATSIPRTLGDSNRTIDSGSFSDWQNASPGNVTFDLAIDFTTDVNVVGGGGGGGAMEFQGTIPTATYSVEVVYEYTPVPEPSSFALIAGVLGLGAVMLRRRR